jgi:hypothetical protein
VGKFKEVILKKNTQVATACEVEDEEATTRTTRSARAKKPRLPHQKHGGDCPPVNNMGETLGGGSEKARDLAKLQNVELVMSSGEIKILPTRIPAIGHCAVIDWLNLTVHEDTFVKTSGNLMCVEFTV